jgi:hypothetical protein
VGEGGRRQGRYERGGDTREKDSLSLVCGAPRCLCVRACSACSRPPHPIRAGNAHSSLARPRSRQPGARPQRSAYVAHAAPSLRRARAPAALGDDRGRCRREEAILETRLGRLQYACCTFIRLHEPSSPPNTLMSGRRHLVGAVHAAIRSFNEVVPVGDVAAAHLHIFSGLRRKPSNFMRLSPGCVMASLDDLSKILELQLLHTIKRRTAHKRPKTVEVTCSSKERVLLLVARRGRLLF